jgi:hypothetical protein
MVTSLSNGSSEGLEDLQSYQGGAAALGYGACGSDDYWEEEDDDDYGVWDDDGEFDARSLGRAASGLRSGSLSRTPGRRPQPRSAGRAQGGGGGGGAGGGGGTGTTPGSGRRAGR